ncbi:phage portal protein [Aurantimonas coralicida]|uniref:phage portal protein n=2 Tax=Aurantimonas coralicida TaxID=182270 RepID=UPI000413A69C
MSEIIAEKPRVRIPAGRSAFRGSMSVPRPYDVVGHPAAPKAPTLGPIQSASYLRDMQKLARHLYRNDAWVRSLVRTLCDIHVGVGPEPVSKFRDLEVLWRQASRDFDNRGVRSFGSWLREDVYRNRIVDGEAFIRRRLRIGRPAASRLTVPLQFQALTSEYVPVDHDPAGFGDYRFRAGVLTQLDRPVAYAMWPSNPLDPDSIGINTRPMQIPADEVFHVFDPMTGGVRGEVLLAVALLRALAIATMEDAERRRKQIASIFNVFFKRTVDAAAGDNADALPDAARVDEMIRSVTLGSGLAFELPPGFEVETTQPKDEPALFEKALRFQILAICAGVGAPVWEVTGDYNDAPERAMRLAGAAVKRRAEIERDGLEHQAINPAWRAFVDTCQATGLWSPPAGTKPWEPYEVTWNWPVVQSAALTQELNVMLNAADRGVVPHSYVTRAYFGMRPEEVARQQAKDLARARENGLQWTEPLWNAEASDTTASIAAEAAAEESSERKTVDQAAKDASVLD